MDNIFCTLFDSNYLDKGLVLYDSMLKHISDFKLYVFTFDDKSFDVIKSENKNNLIAIKLDTLEKAYPYLLSAKKDRNAVEYNWTCSSWSIKYVLEQCKEAICTYIDADMMFFSSPDDIFKTMRSNGCSIIIVPHRFHNDAYEQTEGPKTGFFCVEFNTFVNDENGKKALNWWSNECCKWCHYVVPSIDQWYGDQKYLNEFPSKFAGVYICDHYGIGLAPWNDNRVNLASENNGIINLIDKGNKKTYPLIIYHFAGVRFFNNHIIKVSSRMDDKKLHKLVYDTYIHAIMEKRKYIKDKYNIDITRSWGVPAKNPILHFYQRYLMPIIKLRHLYNLYKVTD